MKRTILFLILLVLLSGCAASEQVQSAQSEHTSAPSASPRPTEKPTASPEATSAPVVPTPLPTPIHRAVTLPDDETVAPNTATIPVGVAYPLSGFSDAQFSNETYGLDIIGGYTEGAFYKWHQYLFGSPPLRAYEFDNKLTESDEDVDVSVTDRTTNLNVLKKEFVLYGADGSRFRGKTHRSATFWSYLEHGWGLRVNYRLDQKNAPLGYYIAVFGTWDAMPRKPKMIDKYGSMEVDLDGDGTEEFIRLKNTKNERGLPCVQFVIEIGGNQFDLAMQVVDPVQYGLYRYGEEEQPNDYVFVFPVDVNGDGAMEVAVFDALSARVQECIIYSVSKDEVIRILDWDRYE